MSLPRFLVHEPATPGDRIALEPDESHHARVRRLAIGDQVALFDGHGHSYTGTVERSSGKQIIARIDTELPLHTGESLLQLTLAVALLKSDRFEWMIEKTTELGVTRIRPFVSAHSVARPSTAKLARWQGIALSAAKQCGRSVIPPVDAPASINEILADAGPESLFFSERSATPTALDGSSQSATAIIGPEGGFSDEEHQLARRAGCTIASLGPRILRAETAAIAAVTLAQARWGDLECGAIAPLSLSHPDSKRR